MSQHKKEHIIENTVNDYSEKLLAFIKPKVRNDEDAEDILQEVWFQFSNLTNISQIVNVGNWLFRVTRNKITDSYRKKKTGNIEDYEPQEEEEGYSSIQELLLLDTSKDPELKFFQDEIWKALFEALEELPETQRLVYIQNEIEEKTLQQIAEEQQTNIKTIISRKQYAVKHLRKRLHQLYKDLDNY
ncbi:MAG: sigma-70 family RNA polymerase sigma factor [Christiangramia sp.]|uniref:RNA polymerase sigma-54 factor RpoN n=1 Tax=Christiangramia flava JLT2011 TaxID=1229726 RepID=A0A1L7I2R7_9FLAO|nr:sigma-70 family RNA polymerase sigma factor [Christiangramia flava]APU67899.1 RNA polymerase sigma-54 factor RpoN [Christiangramia flava JLT2011]MAM19759.1 sigma-70 family RNA polymerase sigma factor [Christiangramia sp.]OSS40401.1 RNA polymerase sigma-54 factor RpoN [Christiangramia flava JLT2011]